MDQPVGRTRPLHTAAPFHFQVSRRLPPPPPLHRRSHDDWQAPLFSPKLHSISLSNYHDSWLLLDNWVKCLILSRFTFRNSPPRFQVSDHLFSTALFAVVASNPMNRVFNCGFPMDSASHDGRTIRAPPPPPPCAPSSPPGWTRFARSSRRRKGGTIKLCLLSQWCRQGM